MSLSEGKRLSHLSGIKVVKKGKIPADIQANGEIYDLLILPAFTLCACYLGCANYKILEEEKVEVPIGLIWDLFNFTSGLTTGRQIMDRHMMIVEKSFELLGFHADLSVKDQNSKRSQGSGLPEKIFSVDEDFTGDIRQFMLQPMLRKAKEGWAWQRHHITSVGVRLVVKSLRPLEI
jgi:hypothetical protein